MASLAISSTLYILFRRSQRPLRADRHTLPVFLWITSEFNQSAWQTANSLLFRPKKWIRPVRTKQATRVSVRLGLTFWIGKVDGLAGRAEPVGGRPGADLEPSSVYDVGVWLWLTGSVRVLLATAWCQGWHCMPGTCLTSEKTITCQFPTQTGISLDNPNCDLSLDIQV